MKTGKIKKLLIANRGEIAIRIARATAGLGIESVAMYAEDDSASLHVRSADTVHPLKGRGAAAYLDMEQIITAAKTLGCDAVHPGYGFLSESADFARKCEQAGIIFVGPSPGVLDLFGDKSQSRHLAQQCGVPLVPGISRALTLDETLAFFKEQGPEAAIMIKALSGGGGRGMRAVYSVDDVADAYERCRSEARTAFGVDDVYAERLISGARHIEVQIIGDGTGTATHLWERDCTLQRRHQKVIEFAPAPGLDPKLRDALVSSAAAMAREVKYSGLGTFEFLVDTATVNSYYFIEANPRVQVEHTVTEMITGIDLVSAQILVAGGRTLKDIGLEQKLIPEPRGMAVQARVNLETMSSDGSVHAAGGSISAYEPPSGPGIRVDGCGYAGLSVNPNYDPLIAKVIVHNQHGHSKALIKSAYRALCEFRLEGVSSNIHVLQNLLLLPEVADYTVTTRFIEDNIETLLAPQEKAHRHLYFPGAQRENITAQSSIEAPPGTVPLSAPNTGMIVCLEVQAGDSIAPGQPVAVMEAMKMEFVVKAPEGGIVRTLAVQAGDNVFEGFPILFIEPADIQDDAVNTETAVDLDAIRTDLAEVIERHAVCLDERRPEAVAKRRKKGQRTARENLADLLDEGSFIEYGSLAVAAQRKILKEEELIRVSPADGLVAGFGSVNGREFGEEAGRCLALAYDYTVFAGTQGIMNHKKIDRMLELAHQWQTPIVLFAEGGGGRPSDTEVPGVSMLDVMTFINMARLSGMMPLVGIVSGRCFAGNAVLLGCCDVIIATENTSLGMAGPAMIEGGGLGKFHPDEVGPVDIQAPNGVIDILVKDEAEAVIAAKQYLSYFQGAKTGWTCPDQRLLRHLIPENRKRIYDIRRVIDTLADEGSVLELRRHFAPGMIIALVRIEGRPFGLIANNTQHLGGAVDSDGADKAARFMQLCDAYDIPMISLCDTPGFMVGPEAEKTALVRHTCRMLVVAGSMTVPYFTIVLRRGYGLGAQAMAGGSFHASTFIVAWPSSEFGPMGLEGAVRLAMGKHLDGIADPELRQKSFEEMVNYAYERGKGTNMASYLEIDDVIDPADTRRWLIRGLASMPEPAKRTEKKRPFIDPW